MTIDELKNLQLKIIKKNKIINTVFLILFLIIFACAIFFLVSTKSFTQNYFFSFFFDFIFLFIIATIVFVIANIIKTIVFGNDMKLFKKEFKNIFVLNSLNKYFDNINYNSEKGIDENVIKNTGMMNTGDRYSSNDFISGTYKGTNFIQSDIHIEEKEEIEDREGNKQTVWKTIFLGRWMIFDFNKEFKANMQVSSFYYSGHFSLYNKQYKRVKLEDLEFNKEFTVYAENEHEAFYILTPHFMEKLKNVKQQLNCGLMFCFVNNKLHIAVSNNKDSFEPNVYKPINEEEIENAIIKDIRLITDLVNDLNLDNDLFKMEGEL